MLNPVIVFLLSAIVPAQQAPALTAAEVQSIEAAVVEELAPADGKVGARPTKGRTLLVDQDQMATVMQKVAATPLAPGLTLPRAFHAAGRDAAIQCARPPRGNCQVANDGIYLTISDAAFVPATGELRVHAAIVWSHPVRDEYDLNGYDVDLFFAHTSSGWRLVRRGTYSVG